MEIKKKKHGIKRLNPIISASEDPSDKG